MPTLQQLAVITLVATVCAVTATLAVHLLGYGDSTSASAAIAGSVSAVCAVTAINMRSKSEDDESEQSAS